MPAPKLFTSTSDGEMVRAFLNACDIYLKITSISDEKTKALFAKTRLIDTVNTWYNSQSYDETTVIFATVKSHMLDYFITSNYIKRARRALVACKMG